jgi:hypothetical protein
VCVRAQQFFSGGKRTHVNKIVRFAFVQFPIGERFVASHYNNTNTTTMPERLLPYNALSQQQRRRTHAPPPVVGSTCCYRDNDDDESSRSSLYTTVDSETLKASDDWLLFHNRIKTLRPHRERRRNLYSSSSSWSVRLCIVLLGFWYNHHPQHSGLVVECFAPAAYRWCSMLKNHSLSVLKKQRQVVKRSDLSASTTIPPLPLSGGGAHNFFRDDKVSHAKEPSPLTHTPDPSWLWTHPKLVPLVKVLNHENAETQSNGRTVASSGSATMDEHNTLHVPSSCRTLDRDNAAAIKVDADQEAFEDAKAKWARTYCSVAGLRASFGGNRNVVWGDLDASTTRRLYKSLLPVALLELYEAASNGNSEQQSSTSRSSLSSSSSSTGTLQPQDLAPLAYRARVAAKLYARERSRVPARVAAAAYDGFRQWRTYGSFDCTGMSYDQVWNKYAALILQETRAQQHNNTNGSLLDDTSSVTAKICLKILERSCQSNEMVDRMVLSQGQKPKNIRQRERDWQQLQAVSAQLERDVRMLLQQAPISAEQQEPVIKSIRKIFLGDSKEDTAADASTAVITPTLERQRRNNVQKFRALRTVAMVKRRIAAISSLDDVRP